MKKSVVFTTMLLCGALLIPHAQADAKKISSLSAAAKKARSLVKGATVTETDRDKEGSVTVYEVTLIKGKKKYEVKYLASNGKLVSYEWDQIGYISSRGRYISKSKVKKLAKKKVKKAKITKAYLDPSDDGDDEYTVKMKKGKKTYTLEYDAFKGKLLSYKWTVAYKKSSSSSSKFIGISKAKSIARKKVPAGTAIVSVELDKDDGIYVYEIEMRKGSMEYEIVINAKTGSVIKVEKDYDD